jgi:hypothetical protein
MSAGRFASVLAVVTALVADALDAAADSREPTDVGVLTVMVNYDAWKTKLISDNRGRYCSQHGYRNHFYTNVTGILGERLRSYEWKATMLHTLIKTHRLLMWLDADVYILDYARTVESFDKSSLGFDVRVGGETMTKYDARYQFSAFSGVVRNTPTGRAFLRHWVANFQLTRNKCSRDQPPMRRALLEMIWESNASPASRKPACLANFTSCPSATSCLDVEAIKLMGGKPLKDERSPKPIWFDDIGPSNPGIALQVKQGVFQWYDNRDCRRERWLPPLQQVLLRSFAIHWNFINPYDFDNYIDYFHRSRGEVELIPQYPYPPGCKYGDGISEACCSSNPNEKTRRACTQSGLSQKRGVCRVSTRVGPRIGPRIVARGSAHGTPHNGARGGALIAALVVTLLVAALVACGCIVSLGLQ